MENKVFEFEFSLSLALSLVVVQALLHVHRNWRLFRDREPRTATFTFTLLLSCGRGPFFCWVTTVNLILVPLSVLKEVYTAHIHNFLFLEQKRY